MRGEAGRREARKLQPLALPGERSAEGGVLVRSTGLSPLDEGAIKLPTELEPAELGEVGCVVPDTSHGWPECRKSPEGCEDSVPDKT